MDTTAMSGPDGPDLQDLLGEIDSVLRAQSDAVHEENAGRVASLGVRGVDLLQALPGHLALLQGMEVTRVREQLGRLRELAGYNQQLMRYALTSWSGAFVDRERQSPGYDDKGQRKGRTERPERKGTLAKGVL